MDHPAAVELAELVAVEACDDLYTGHDSFEPVYDAIADRVIAAAADGPVVYGVPGSPRVGEFAVRRIRDLAEERGVPVELIEAPSFVDAICDLFAVDPLRDGLTILDAHQLPDPLVVSGPAIIAHLNSPGVVADVAARLGDVAGPDLIVHLVTNAGAPAADIWEGHPDDLHPDFAHVRASLFIAGGIGGLRGAIDTMRTLRAACPWDRDQTHHSLIPNLIEESHELADALAALPTRAPQGAGSHAAYGDVEEELGDVLLQVLFHIAMGEEVGALRVDRVAEHLRQKLIRRHPHIFGESHAESPADVRALWDEIKATEKATTGSILDTVPVALPPLARADQVSRRAAGVGFDWLSAADVFAKFDEELAELRQAMAGEDADEVNHELGDLLFTTVNLGRHLGVDAQAALIGAVQRVERRIRLMEDAGPLQDVSLDELNDRWEAAKRQG